MKLIKVLDKRNYGSVVALYKCACGNLSEHVRYRVLRGDIKSCGCSRLGIRNTETRALNQMYADYKSRANKKNLKFTLSRKRFYKLVNSKCHYCKSPPLFIYRKFNHVINGIDRKDNNLGYTLKNSVACCMVCNRAKNNMLYKDFKMWIKRIKNYESEY